MPGIIPAPGNLSMNDLAATLTSHEQYAFEQVTGLAIDPNAMRNLVTTVAQMHQLGPLALRAPGQSCEGTRILSTTAYIHGAKTPVDLYRLPLHPSPTTGSLQAHAEQEPDEAPEDNLPEDSDELPQEEEPQRHQPGPSPHRDGAPPADPEGRPARHEPPTPDTEADPSPS